MWVQFQQLNCVLPKLLFPVTELFLQVQTDFVYLFICSPRFQDCMNLLHGSKVTDGVLIYWLEAIWFVNYQVFYFTFHIPELKVNFNILLSPSLFCWALLWRGKKLLQGDFHQTSLPQVWKILSFLWRFLIIYLNFTFKINSTFQYLYSALIH